MRRALLSIVAVSALTASLVVTAPLAPASATTTGTEVADCLVRSAIVPVAVEADAAPEVARTAALRSLQHALLTGGADVLAAAELRLDAQSDAVGLDVREATAGASARLVGEAIAALPPAAQAHLSPADVHVVGSAEHSLRALCAGFEVALAAAQGDGDAIVSVAIDQRRGALRVGLDAADAAAQLPALERQARTMPSAVAGEAPAAAEPSTLTAIGLDGVDVPVELIADTADRAASTRLDDRDGLGGGVGILVGGAVACSSGFGVRLDDGSRAILGAGHCASPVGSDGDAISNGFASGLCGSSGSGAPIGTISHNRLLPDWVDAMAVRTLSAAPTMWLGSACTGTYEAAVEGIGVIGAGGSVGFSGVRHGERYAYRTDEPIGCYDFEFGDGVLACAVYRSMSSSTSYVCEPGDSGGPVFQHRGDGTVRAVGLITATGAPLGINRCSYTDVATALWAIGASMMTQTPAELPTPTRIAGDDRYATAAAISRDGYPTGARRVFVASGEVFADALSAGSAAARLRAPLLLTQRDRLPAPVRDELLRLRPTSIVIVGGEPSVSAQVAAELAGIARVERLGGADRYATSAMIARYAFPAGTTSRAYVATGRNFPDALSAGPAAALHAAPVLLVDGTARAAPRSTLEAMRALGVTSVSVVGGTPSVSAAVAGSLGDGRTVERIAGADRYETAIRVNAAFGPTPQRFYLASGSRFPDALAASAVAGAQRSPLYLSTASCVPQGVQAEHRRLGSPPVVLLGGFPSLRGAVLEWAPCT